MRYLLFTFYIFIFTGCNIIETDRLNSIQTINTQTKEEIIDLINSIRANGRYCGDKYFDATKPLKWNQKLYNASYEHSWDMKESGKFSHDGSGTISDKTANDLKLNRGSYFNERIEHNGYRYQLAGENIYYSSYKSSASDAIDAWVKSPPHCENLMNPNFKEVAVAVVYGDDGSSYWTQDFGTSRR